MKHPWHIYNVKQRIASLPAITLEAFEQEIQVQAKSAKKKNSNESINVKSAGKVAKKTVEEPPDVEISTGETGEQTTEPSDGEDTTSPLQCLFCSRRFDGDTEDVEDNLEHMFSVHGLFIPNYTMISDLESFLGYLATAVRVWHECLYCGTTRNTTSAIQSHMKDSSHCMLNLDREPELLEFWEERNNEEGQSDGEDKSRPGISSTNELQLLSGKVVGSRKDPPLKKIKAVKAREMRLALRTAQKPSDPSASPDPPKKQVGRQLARREEMSIMNISSQERQALVLAEWRSQKEEAIGKRVSEWSYGRRANSQKHDQNYGPLSWAKGGMHNLLPR